MKNVSTIFKTVLLVFILSLSFFSCKKEDDVPANTGGSIPSNGWQLGTNAYSTVFF